MKAARIALLLLAGGACGSDRAAAGDGVATGVPLAVDPADYQLREVDRFETDATIGGVTWDGERLWLAYHQPVGYWETDVVTLVALDATHAEVAKLDVADDYTPPRGLAWRDGRLWLNRSHIGGSTADLLLELDPTTGEELRSFATDDGAMDVAFDGRFLLVANLWGIVQRIDPANGWLDAELRTPYPVDSGYMRGVAHRPGEIWLGGGSFDDHLSIIDEEGHHLGDATIPIADWAEGTSEVELYLAFAGDRLVFATNHAVYLFDVVGAD